MDGKLAGMVCPNAQGRAVEVSFDWDRGRGVGWSVEGLGDCYAYSQVFERDAWRPWLVGRASAGQGGLHGGANRVFAYAFDRLGRPVSRSGDAFAYNARGEVTNAVVGGDAFRYAYDHIGNRTAANEDGKNTLYQSNAVNQYTNLTSNLSPLTSNLSYDLDGNLVDDGTRTFAWSASGRLTEAASATASRRYACEYDHLGRRVRRTEYRRIGRPWVLVEDREYVYDGWNLVHETRTASGVETDIEYFWGPDLSGTFQGAGGVGGLVAVSIGGSFYFPGYDNNGNVIGYWNEDGDLVAEYAYDAFGNTIDEDGDMADFFPHRFSTKYYDAETDLYYYGYRYYSPSLGRWISRDPIGEEDCNNLYLFCCNGSLNTNDPFGLYRYITDFSLIAWNDEWYWFAARWHVGVSVDTWKKRKMGKEDCCWAWEWTGVKTFDFQMDYSNPFNYTQTGRIKETDGILVQEPHRVLSTQEQDIKMLTLLKMEKMHPKAYNIFTHNCIHWSWNALTYGMDAPMDSSSCYPKRIFFDSPHRETPLVSDQNWSMFH